MKKAVIVIVIVIIVALAAFLYYQNRGGRLTQYSNSSSENKTNTTTPMTISSPVFQNTQAIPKKYTCDDVGVNPPLTIADVPKEAESLALIVEDPDAPSGTWTHWVMWNILPSVSSIAEGSVPLGATVGQGSSGQNVFGAFCPPNGTHHYYFRLYALPMKLSISSFSDAAALRKAMDGNVIGDPAELMGTYTRGQ